MPVKNNNRADRAKNRKAGNSPRLSAEEQKTALARQLRIKPRTKAMVDMLEEDKSLSQTEAYIRTHETSSRKNAAIAASKILKKPNVQIYSNSVVKKAKTRIGSLVDSSNESIALKASQDIIDRTEGKAIQRNETTSKTVTVSLDLSGLRIGAHYIRPEQLSPPAQ